MESRRAVFERKKNWSFQHDAIKRAKTTTLPALSLEHPQSQDVQDSAKAISPSGRRPSGNSLACHARTIWNVLARILLVNSGRLQRGRSTNLRKAAHSGISAYSHTTRSRNNLPKKVSKSGDESAVALLKDKEFWLYLSTWRRQDRHRF